MTQLLVFLKLHLLTIIVVLLGLLPKSNPTNDCCLKYFYNYFFHE